MCTYLLTTLTVFKSCSYNVFSHSQCRRTHPCYITIVLLCHTKWLVVPSQLTWSHFTISRNKSTVCSQTRLTILEKKNKKNLFCQGNLTANLHICIFKGILCYKAFLHLLYFVDNLPSHANRSFPKWLYHLIFLLRTKLLPCMMTEELNFPLFHNLPLHTITVYDSTAHWWSVWIICALPFIL